MYLDESFEFPLHLIPLLIVQNDYDLPSNLSFIHYLLLTINP